MVNVRKKKSVQTTGSPPEVTGRRNDVSQVGGSHDVGNVSSGLDDGDYSQEAMNAGSARSCGMELLIHRDESLVPSGFRPVDSLIRLANQPEKSLIRFDSRSSTPLGGEDRSENDCHVFAFTGSWPPLPSAESVRSHGSGSKDGEGVVIPLLHGEDAHGSATCRQKMSMFRLQRLRSTTVT